MSDAPDEGVDHDALDEGVIHYVVVDATGSVRSAGNTATGSWPMLQKVCGGVEVSAEIYAQLKSGRFLYRDGVISSKPVDPVEVARNAITHRNRLLAASDWSQAADIPHAPEVAALWRSYRQALRDIPAQAGFPAAVEWPTPPGDLQFRRI